MGPWDRSGQGELVVVKIFLCAVLMGALTGVVTCGGGGGADGAPTPPATGGGSGCGGTEDTGGTNGTGDGADPGGGDGGSGDLATTTILAVAESQRVNPSASLQWQLSIRRS